MSAVCNTFRIPDWPSRIRDWPSNFSPIQDWTYVLKNIRYLPDLTYVQCRIRVWTSRKSDSRLDVIRLWTLTYMNFDRFFPSLLLQAHVISSMLQRKLFFRRNRWLLFDFLLDGMINDKYGRLFIDANLDSDCHYRKNTGEGVPYECVMVKVHKRIIFRHAFTVKE